MSVNKFDELIHELRVLRHIKKNIKNWFEFLQAHFKNDYLIEVRPDQSDVTMLMETWGMKYYTPKGFDVKETDIVIDIGAHIGSFSLYAAWKAKKGKVYSFEPFPENYKMFKGNIERNKINNIVAEQKAIATKRGDSKLFLYSGTHTGSNSLYHRNTNNTINIQTISLKDVFEKNKIKKVDFMKIDCEGAEYEILFSLQKKILKKIKKISMEYHDEINEHNHKELMDFFKNNGWNAKLVGEFIYAKNKNIKESK